MSLSILGSVTHSPFNSWLGHIWNQNLQSWETGSKDLMRWWQPKKPGFSCQQSPWHVLCFIAPHQLTPISKRYMVEASQYLLQNPFIWNPHCCYKSGFLNLSTMDILSQIILCWGRGLSVHCRVFSNILDFSPLYASSTAQVVTTKNVSRHCWGWRGHCPQWKTTVLIEDHRIREIIPYTLSKGSGRFDGEWTDAATDYYIVGHFSHVTLILWGVSYHLPNGK